jgi:hypothetical protein
MIFQPNHRPQKRQAGGSSQTEEVICGAISRDSLGNAWSSAPDCGLTEESRRFQYYEKWAIAPKVGKENT